MSDEKNAETHEFWATAIYDAGLLPRPISASLPAPTQEGND